MKKGLNRAILIQSNDELAQYTSSLLDQIGFRHIHRAINREESMDLLSQFEQNGKEIDLVVVDDSIEGGVLGFKSHLKNLNTLIITKENNPNNLSLYAEFSMKKIIFLPYGRKQIEKSILMVGN
jgi:homospermidine synthase